MWEPVLSFGQTLIDVISTPLYFVEGGINAAQKGKNPIVGAAENAVAWTNGKRPATGKDILKNVGMSDDFWSSLIADIALDPLTYTPGTVISTPIKAAAAAARFGIKGATAASRGAVSKTAAQITKAATKAPADTIVKAPLPKTAKITSEELYQRTLASQKQMEKFVYQPVKVEGQRSISDALVQMLASGLEAGYKGAAMSVQKSALKSATRKIDKKVGRELRKGIAVQAPKFIDETIDDAIRTVESRGASDITPADAVAEVANTTRAESIPVIDQPVQKVSVAELAAAQKPVSKVTAKEIQSNLNKVDKLVQGIKVTSQSRDETIKAIQNVLKQQPSNQFLAEQIGKNADIVKNLGYAIVRDGTDPAKMIAKFADSSDQAQRALYSMIKNAQVATTNGMPVLVSDVLSRAEYAVPFAQLPDQIKESLTNLLINVKRVASNGAKGVESEGQRAIAGLLGEKFARDMAKTGVFDYTRATDEAALKKIIDSVPEIGEKSYKNFDEFIAGIKLGDDVSFDALTKVARLLDPEGKQMDAIEKAASGPRSTDVMKSILIRDGVQTVRQMRQDLKNLDSEALFNSTNIAAADVAFATTNDVLNGMKELDVRATMQTRAAAGEELVKIAEQEFGRGAIQLATDNIGKAFQTRMGQIYRTTEEAISKHGQLYSRAYREDGSTEAYVNNQVNQYIETEITARRFAIKTYRRGKAAEKRAKDITAGKAPKPERSQLQFEQDIINLAKITDNVLLSTFGVRIVHVRSVAKTKGVKENQYHHYVNLGDVMEVAKATNTKSGEMSTFMKLIAPDVAYPALKIDPKVDSLSFQNVLDAVSDVLRGVEKKTKVDKAKIKKSLMTPSPGKTWTKDFKAVVDENIDEVVEFLTGDDTARVFMETHVSKLKAEVIDSIEPAQRFSTAMVDTMLGAYTAMRDAGVTTQMQRDKIAYDWMLKFAAIADTFAFSNGSVARETFRATAQVFLNLAEPTVKGPVASEWRQKLLDLANANPHNSEIYDEFMGSIASHFKWEPTTKSAIKGVTDDAIDAAEKAWASAKNDFEISVKELTNDLTPQGVVAWQKKHKEFETALRAARKQMGKAGLETDYWNGKTWVPADQFNRKTALAEASKASTRYIYTKSGVIDIARWLVDGAVETPTFKKYGTKYTPETKALFESQAAELRTKIAKNDKTGAQEDVMARSAEFDALHPEDPAAAAIRMEEETQALRFDESSIRVDVETPAPGAKAADGTDIPTFWTQSNLRTALQEEGMTRGRRLGQMLQGGAGFRDLYSVMVRSEATAHNATADVAEALRHAFTLFRKAKLKAEDMDTALANAMERNFMDNPGGDAVAEMSRVFGKVLEATEHHAVNRGLHPKYLHEAFKIAGIDKFIPDWSLYKSAKDVPRILAMLPIGRAPQHLINQAEDLTLSPLERSNAQIAINEWNNARDAFQALAAKNGDTAANVGLFYKAISAIQSASREATLASMLVEDFNFMNYFPGLTKEAAYKKALASGDFVAVKSASNGHSLLKWVDDKDNLFPKDIAKQIGAFERHYNYTLENNMNKFVKNSLFILSIFKTTQTVLRPGHAVNTAVGDSMTSLMRGTNPLLFAPATRIAARMAGGKIKADYVANALDNRIKLLEGSLSGLSRAEIKEAESGMRFAIGKGGVTLSEDQLDQLLRNSGAFKTNIAATDEMMSMTELQAFAAGTDVSAAYDKMLTEKMKSGASLAGAKRTWLSLTKPAGDVVAYVGNVPRIATALDVLKKGNFKSIEDAEKAIAEELATYHPTIESLSPFERQKIRPWASYYTWLRGAHFAMYKMAAEHTKTLLIPSKVFYNQALANEMGPGSIGNLWGDKQETPSYFDYSTYGPTMQGPRGGIVYRPSVLPLDVLDTWNIQFDPTKTLEKQAFDNLNSVGQGVIGKNINMVFQPGIEFITGTDPSTGKPSTVKDLKSAGDNLLSNIGTMQLLQGLGLYTPPNKGPESANPITQRDRDIKVLNYMFGPRMYDTGVASALKNAKSEESARLRRVIEDLIKQQETTNAE